MSVPSSSSSTSGAAPNVAPNPSPSAPSQSSPSNLSASSAPPPGTINPTDITNIVQAVLLANQQAQQAAQAPAVQVRQPPAPQPQQAHAGFHLTGPPSINPSAGKLSLQDVFPEVESNVLAAVANHTLSANELYKLDARYRDKPERSTLELDGTSLRIKGDATTRDYPSLSYIHQPMVNYFTILTHAVPDSMHFAVAAMLYMGQLQKLSDEYEWPAVLRYHLICFLRRRQEMRRGDYIRWGLRDSDLFDEFLVGHRRQKPAEQKKTNNKTSAATEVCRNFNAGTCTSPCRGGRLHRCQTCGSEAHGANTHRR